MLLLSLFCSEREVKPSINKDFPNLTEADIPRTYSQPIEPLSRQAVMKRLKDFRKPKSMVEGDIFPATVGDAAPTLAVLLTDIYNCISSSGYWPEQWKTEYVTTIPKTPHPQSLNDVRNISCTRLFSKVYESFLLSWITDQVGIRENQYGGMKGAGMEHFLVQLWQEVLEGLEDQRAAVTMTSVDYSKAFNRLSFPHCLESLARKGASSEVLKIVGSFLTNRIMKAKVGDVLSDGVIVSGGVPQGSLLGLRLFNAAIGSFEEASPDVKDYGVIGGRPDAEANYQQDWTGRFSGWFPPNTNVRGTRAALEFHEDFARTERLRNSPLFAMRRSLNGRP